MSLAPPSPGPRRALASTPPAAPGSVRRTTSIDVTRPDGLLGPVVVALAGRDRTVDPEGRARVLAKVSLAVRVGVSGLVEGIDVEGFDGDGPAGLAGLVGAGLRSGFGRRAAATLPDDAARRTLLGTLLDDLPGAYHVSGYALARGGVLPDGANGPERAALQADVCAGWAVGRPLHDLLAAEGRIAVPSGPPAPVLEQADPDGWHDLPALGEGTVRRRRLLEVTAAAGAGLDVHAHFRDSWFGDGHEVALHEYSIEAAVDGDGRISRVEVDPRVLPWDACPGAVASASRMVGVAVADLPARVRAELAGPSTCTHLNSMLRSLADVSALRPGTG
ncbi:MAG TPA: DUF2889 domain-containing protein [Acidimicrobiales bacterium]|nr:DUF2889 domain-containing protein [Acidimicrobiales bacterium]